MAIRDRLEGITTRAREGAKGAASTAASAYAETARDVGSRARREAGRGKRAAVKRARQELEAAGGRADEDEQDAMFRRAEEVATAGPAVDATFEPVSNLENMDKLVTGGFDEATGSSTSGSGVNVAFSNRVGAWAVVTDEGDVVDTLDDRGAAIDRAASFARGSGQYDTVRVFDRSGNVEERIDVDRDGASMGGSVGFDVGVGLSIGGGPGGDQGVEDDPLGVGLGFGLEGDEGGDQEADPFGVGFGGFGSEGGEDDDELDPFGVGLGFGGDR